MRDRDERRTIPDRGNYFHVDLEERGRHDFRVPPPTRFSAIIDLMTGDDMQDLASTAKDAGKGKAAFALSKSMGGMCSLNGALLGVCWWNTDRDIESVWDGEPESIKSYGQTVYEELWDADYSFEEIVVLWAKCYKVLVSSFVEQKDVMRAVGFIKTEDPAPQSGNDTTSESATSATPGDGGA